MQNEKIKEVMNLVDNLGQYINKLENKIFVLTNKEKRCCDFYTYKIVRSIIKLLCNGFDEDTAVEIVAEDYKSQLKLQHIKMIWHNSRRQKNALDLYARIYMVKRMKIAGFPTSEIANTLNVSITTVNKLLKSNFWGIE